MSKQKLYASGNCEAAGINPLSSCSRTVGATLSAGSLAALRTSARKLGTETRLYLHNGYNIDDACLLALPPPAPLPLPPIACSTEIQMQSCGQHCTILNA